MKSFSELNSNIKLHTDSFSKKNFEISLLEPVEIRKDSNNIDNKTVKTPEYVHVENRSPMKKAQIIGETNTNMGLTERPNYLSPVIQSFATSVLTPTTSTHDGNMTFDLDKIKKRQFFERMSKTSLSSNPNMLQFTGDNINITPNINDISLHPQTSSISTSLPNNLDLNVSIPNSEKLNNLNGPYLSNLNIGNLPINALGIKNLPNMTARQIINENNQTFNMNNLQGITIKNDIINSISQQSNLELGVVNPAFNSLNASLLPTPIPLGGEKVNKINMILTPLAAGHQVTDRNSHMFNLNVHYKNQIPNETTDLVNLTTLEKTLEHLENLPDSEFGAILSHLRAHEKSMTLENQKLYKSLKRYENQNNVIMDTLKEQINETHNQISSMIVDVPLNERPIINKEIEDQFTKSLSGFTINKNKYTHLKEIDPTELINISNHIKKELDRNDKFYLHGDFNFYN